MPICPNCNTEVTGNFCPFCGLSVAQMPAQPQIQPFPQQYQQPPGAPPAQYGPPIGVLIGRSPAAKIGIALMIIAILGLILAMIIPWITVEKEVEDGGKENFSFNHDLEIVDGDEEGWGGDEFTTHDETEDYLRGSIGLSFIGFILAIVLAIVLIIIGVMSYSSGYTRNLFHGLGAIIGVILLFSGIMIIVSGMNFLGFNIAEIHSNSVTEELGGEVSTSTVYPAAYLVLIFGIIRFLISLVITKKELSNTSPTQLPTRLTAQPPAQPPMQPQQPSSPQYPGGGVHG